MASAGSLSEIDFSSLGDDEPESKPVRSEDEEIDLSRPGRTAVAGPVLKLVNVMLVDSLKRRASAIHVEPYEKEFRIRFRIDDVLFNVMALPMKLRDPLTTRLKLMAGLDIAEKRLPQEGRIRIRMKVGDRSRELAYRITTWPTQWGETIVMQLQDQAQLILDMTRFGFEPHTLERFRNAIVRPSGIVLVTGPRRSGKTNTLYSALAALNKPDIHIMTAEDAPDLSLPGINQLPLRPHLGLKAASVLQLLRRADADVILASEITDPEAARAAVSLAQHGHLVLSTLPTSDAPSTVTYLLSMGIEPFLVATTVNLILAQRLVRRICEGCKVDVTAEVPRKLLNDIGFADEYVGTFPLYRGSGCPDCHGTGYKGRVGLFEGLEISDAVRDLILVSATTEEIKRRALEEGMLTLRMSGLEKVRRGVTTIDEVLRDTVL
jgi:type IV pilus assembly protein PilB